MRYDLLIRKVRNISSSQKSILYTLATYMGNNDICWPSLQTIADDCGLTKANTYNNLKKLSELDYVIITRAPKSSRYITNRYELNIDKLSGIAAIPLANSAVSLEHQLQPKIPLSGIAPIPLRYRSDTQYINININFNEILYLNLLLDLILKNNLLFHFLLTCTTKLHNYLKELTIMNNPTKFDPSILPNPPNEPRTDSNNTPNFNPNDQGSSTRHRGVVPYSNEEMFVIKEPVGYLEEIRTFDKKLYEPSSKYFDKAVMLERRKYLLSLSYDQAKNLPRGDQYDRLKFQQEIDAYRYLESLKK